MQPMQHLQPRRVQPPTPPIAFYRQRYLQVGPYRGWRIKARATRCRHGRTHTAAAASEPLAAANVLLERVTPRRLVGNRCELVGAQRE